VNNAGAIWAEKTDGLGFVYALTLAGGNLDNTSAAALTLAANTTAMRIAFSGDFTFVGTHDLNLGASAVGLQNGIVR